MSKNCHSCCLRFCVCTSGFVPTTGLVHALTRRRMTAKLPGVTHRVQGVLKDGHHHHVETSVAHHQGEMTDERRPPGGAVRPVGHQGGARTDKDP